MRYHPKKPWHLPSSALTSEAARAARKRSRRGLLRQGAGLVGASLAMPLVGCETILGEKEDEGVPTSKIPLSEPFADLLRPGFPAPRHKGFRAGRPLTEEIVAATHNNFYEFTTEKWRVWKLVGDFEPRPWTVQVSDPDTPGVWGLYTFDEFVVAYRAILRRVRETVQP